MKGSHLKSRLLRAAHRFVRACPRKETETRITPEMIEAGAVAVSGYSMDEPAEERAIEVYLAMERTRNLSQRV